MNRTLRIYLLETKYEFLKLLRMPSFAVPALLFPVLFYVMFGIGFGSRSAGSVNIGMYLLATYGSFGVLGACLFGFGVTVANERGQGWLEVKRTTPMPVSAYFVAKMAMAMLFSSIIVLLLFTTAALLGKNQLSFVQAVSLFAVLVSGAVTFSALGLTIGYFATPNAAPAIVNIIYMPLSFLSGLWIPVMGLPKAVQNIAPFLPPYHYSQLALKTIGASRGTPTSTHVLAMVAATAVFSALAYVGYRRDEGAHG